MKGTFIRFPYMWHSPGLSLLSYTHAHIPVSSVLTNRVKRIVLGGSEMVTLYSVKGCRGGQVNVPSWPCSISSPFTSSASQGGEECSSSRHLARMSWQGSGSLQLQLSLMLVLEISKVPGTTWRTSVKETLQEGHSIPLPALQPCSHPHHPLTSLSPAQCR